MAYIDIVKNDFEEFAKYNVKNYKENTLLMIPEKVSNINYPLIEYVPFFLFKGENLLFTSNQLDDNRINKDVLMYAVNLCFNSEMSFKYENKDIISNTYSAVYYCLLEKMYKTLNKNDLESVLYLID
ncbi:hypothetical protein N1H60_004630 [Salmonella enterica subsp. enterica serovar Kentucky]|nr:hypothetical protein [Salmonella enterica]EJR7219565.1 hypothetical protein [Salmonella enterica subsp. enterica serovar Kentucky]